MYGYYLCVSTWFPVYGSTTLLLDRRYQAIARSLSIFSTCSGMTFRVLLIDPFGLCGRCCAHLVDISFGVGVPLSFIG